MTAAGMVGKCALCRFAAVDSLDFETGNNAEHSVAVPLCAAHVAEAERTGYDFEEKYAAEILERLYESWRGQADHLLDEHK